MGLTALVADPLVEPSPPGWDSFVTDQRLLPAWHSTLLRAADWCAPAASSMALVVEAASGTPVAGFHVRHRAPGRPSRLVSPGRTPRLGLAVCRLTPTLSSGVAFADAADAADRAEAVRVFERAVRRRFGPAGRIVAYRSLLAPDLPPVGRFGRLRRARGPLLTVTNEWADLAGYLASLPARLRQERSRLRRVVDADGDPSRAVQVALAGSVEPQQVCWLVESVRRRHLPAAVAAASPACPADYFRRLSALPGALYLTYRDRSGRLLAVMAGYDDGDQLVGLLWGGRSGTDGGRRDLYLDHLLRMVELTVSRGRRRLVLGGALAGTKIRYGARPEPRWDVVCPW